MGCALDDPVDEAGAEVLAVDRGDSAVDLGEAVGKGVVCGVVICGDNACEVVANGELER